MTHTYTVRAIPDGKYWALEVPELDRFTMATNIKEIDLMAKDLISILTDEKKPKIAVEYVVPQEIQESLQLKAEAQRLELQAQAKQREAAISLHNKGITLRDIGALLGISYQRVHQLIQA